MKIEVVFLDDGVRVSLNLMCFNIKPSSLGFIASGRAFTAPSHYLYLPTLRNLNPSYEPGSSMMTKPWVGIAFKQVSTDYVVGRKFLSPLSHPPGISHICCIYIVIPP
jgi:hypothetical protein